MRSRRIRSGRRKVALEARICYAIQGGYDTHVAQANLHAGRLSDLAGAIRNFFATLQASGLAERVVLMTFSEFGRRVQENDGRRNDHGAAGPMLLVGPAVRGGCTESTRP